MGSQRPAVQAKAMAIFASREAESEDASQVFAGNPHAVIHHRNLDSPTPVGHPYGQTLVSSARLIKGALGVANQVDQNLQDLFCSVD